MKKLLFVILALLLLTLVVSNTYLAMLTSQDRQVQLMRAKSMQPLLERQRSIITSMMDHYETDAYNNPDIERIAEQQLIAAEYQLLLLQTIAQQNILMLELSTNY